MTKTLVLSTGFEPLAEIPWQQAMKMWCAGRVEVVDEYRNQAIRTVSNRFQLPAVVRFISQVFRRHLKPQIRLTRRNLYLRDQGHDVTDMMLKMEDVIIKTLISAEMPIASACKTFMPFNGNCFG